MFRRLEVFKYKIVFLHTAVALGSPVFRWSDEGGPKAFQAPLDAGARRLINPVQRLELLRAQLVISLLVLPVEGLCR